MIGIDGFFKSFHVLRHAEKCNLADIGCFTATTSSSLCGRRYHRTLQNKKRNRTDNTDTDGCQAVFNGSVSTNAINTHHFEMFSDKICSEKSNYVARVSAADVATERKVRGTVRQTVGSRYTALTPHYKTPAVAMTRCTERPTTGIMAVTPHLPSYSLSITIPSSRVRTRCVRVCTCDAHCCQPRVPKNKAEDLLFLLFP